MREILTTNKSGEGIEAELISHCGEPLIYEDEIILHGRNQTYATLYSGMEVSPLLRQNIFTL